MKRAHVLAMVLTCVLSVAFQRSAHACGEMTGGQSLNLEQQILSCNGQFTLFFTGGNLVLYRTNVGPLWATGTNHIGTRVDMQTDGNLVVLASDGYPYWKTNTGGNSGAVLKIQDDGNLVIALGSKVLWSTDTWAPPAPNNCGRILPGQGLGPGTSLFSCDGKYELQMLTNGNLRIVAYDNGNASVSWAANTNVMGSRLYLWPNGNLTVVAPGGAVQLQSNTSGHPYDFALIDGIDSAGDLYVYDGGPIWSAYTIIQ